MTNTKNLRVPRASNLVDLKCLLKKFQDKPNRKKLLNFDKLKKASHLIEYFKLLKLLNLIYEDRYFFTLTQRGKYIKHNISDSDKLTEQDVQILKEDFLKMEIVKLFFKNVFHFDISKNVLPNFDCLSKDEIKKRYLSYRKISESVAARESRYIYNWLLDLETIEPLYNFKKYEVSNVCYHIIGKDLDLNEFSKKIKIAIFKANIMKSDWIEIPVVRNLFCIRNNISKEQFNKLFIEYIDKNPFDFQLSTGSLLRKEVEKEGVQINRKIYFYVKLTRDN